MCNWENNLPATIPGNAAMSGIEDRVVTLQGYVLAVRFEAGPADHDFHIEMSGTTGWSTRAHVIVEIPPGQNYCTARQALWQLAKDDASPGHPGNTYYFVHPKKIQVVGFVFYDKAPSHTDNGDCTANGGRGLHKNGQPSMVHGLWELHPVIKIQDAVAIP